MLTLPLSAADLTSQLDALAAKFYKANEPGAAVLVIKDGKTLLRKGYGLADVELNVPVTPDNVFRIGSVTKQFTAVAVLQLVQQGKLALEDDVTKHLPDFPTQGKKVTIEHLLTHTSGIPSYTGLPAMNRIRRQEVSPTELIETFKGVPFEFEPGSKWAYNNSGYVLLGAIVEKLSGIKYADYVRKNLFTPAGLTHTDYEDQAKIIPKRAKGYSQMGPDHYVNAPFLSMTVPYAAGALISTVDDLARWNDALNSGKLVDPKLLARAHKGYMLTDGKPTNYGFGWAESAYEGHRVVQHGGAINGFLSALLTMPNDKLVVVVLGNANRQPTPGYVAALLAGAAIGKPYEPKTITLANDVLDRYSGVYQVDERLKHRVRRDGERLLLIPGDGPPSELMPVSETEFAVKDSMNRVRFTVTNGKVTTMTTESYGPPEAATRTEEKIVERKETKVDPALYQKYVGRYELAPTFSITVTADTEHLYAQATGQPRFELFPESERKFFLKVVDAQVSFDVDDKGVVTGLVLHQNGRSMPGKKVE